MLPQATCRLDVVLTCTGTSLDTTHFMVIGLSVSTKKRCPDAMRTVRGVRRGPWWCLVMRSGNARQRIRVFGDLAHRIGDSIPFQNPLHLSYVRAWS